MDFVIKTTTKIDDAASFMASSILNQLTLGKHVLFFVTGGSSIAVGIKVAEILRESSHQNIIHNLTIMLTDERYGPVDHIDSNWRQLIKRGFSLTEAKLIPILSGDDRDTTVKNFNENLKKEFEINKENKYKIGLFGVGLDGHTAGILPESPAVNCEDMAFGYDTPAFSRITLTPKAIEKLDEVIVWAQNKDNVIESLEKDIEIIKQPAQILKKVPLLTIFTNYKNTKKI